MELVLADRDGKLFPVDGAHSVFVRLLVFFVAGGAGLILLLPLELLSSGIDQRHPALGALVFFAIIKAARAVAAAMIEDLLLVLDLTVTAAAIYNALLLFQSYRDDIQRHRIDLLDLSVLDPCEIPLEDREPLTCGQARIRRVMLFALSEGVVECDLQLPREVAPAKAPVAHGREAVGILAVRIRKITVDDVLPHILSAPHVIGELARDHHEEEDGRQCEKIVGERSHIAPICLILPLRRRKGHLTHRAGVLIELEAVRVDDRDLYGRLHDDVVPLQIADEDVPIVQIFDRLDDGDAELDHLFFGRIRKVLIDADLCAHQQLMQCDPLDLRHHIAYHLAGGGGRDHLRETDRGVPEPRLDEQIDLFSAIKRLFVAGLAIVEQLDHCRSAVSVLDESIVYRTFAALPDQRAHGHRERISAVRRVQDIALLVCLRHSVIVEAAIIHLGRDVERRDRGRCPVCFSLRVIEPRCRILHDVCQIAELVDLLDRDGVTEAVHRTRSVQCERILCKRMVLCDQGQVVLLLISQQVLKDRTVRKAVLLTSAGLYRSLLLESHELRKRFLRLHSKTRIGSIIASLDQLLNALIRDIDLCLIPFQVRHRVVKKGAELIVETRAGVNEDIGVSVHLFKVFLCLCFLRRIGCHIAHRCTSFLLMYISLT